MYVSARNRVLLFVVLFLALTGSAAADNVTISGTVNFASLDGSSLDHDGAANGTFTVSDGDLSILGTINCNDDSATNACSMAFAVSGNFTMQPGSAIYAENRTGGGAGGNVTITAGGDIVLSAPNATSAGAIISAGNADTSASSAGGALTFTAGGLVRFGSGSVVSAAAKGGQAGAINVTAEKLVEVGGLIASGPSSTLSSTRYTAAVLTGGSASHSGGRITLVSHSHSEPSLVVTSSAIVVSQGGSGSAGAVTLEGCGINVSGLVASISASGANATVTVNSGTTLTVDGSNLGAASGTGRGMVRADALDQSASAFTANLFARENITVLGPVSGSLYAVTSNGGTTSRDASGTVRVISTGGAISATGSAFAATNADSGDQGGTIVVAASGSINLSTARLNASGDQSTSNPDRAGGTISVRSHSGAVSWQNGSGDVRPTGSGSGITAAKQGTITITYCTTVALNGSTFASNGAPVGAFPTTVQSCTPSAPALPAGIQQPDCNDPPVVANDAYVVDEGASLNVAAPGVLANDVDPDGDAMTATLVSGPAHASSFTFNANGSFSYTHNGSENHSDTFTYRASDGTSQSTIATVTIAVTPVNDAPVASNDSYTVAEGGTINYAAPGVLANDSDSDGPANTAVLVSGPSNASSFVLNANGSFVYVHNGGETTTDSFSYKASDGSLQSGVATVSIAITPVNDAPVANADSASVNEGGTLNGMSVLANDTDAENSSLTAVLVSVPANAASFTLNANGTYSYVHNGSETTSDSFTYKANDGSADSNVVTVSITVNAVNDAPVANADSASVDEGGTLNGTSVLANDTDAENSSLTAVLVSGPANAASFTLNANGTYTYVHNGGETTSDSFSYKANDGAADSNVVTVSISVNAINDAPVANADSASVNEGGTLNGTSVLANDTDAENSSLTAVLVSGPANAASFTLNANGTYTYVHNGGETTSDSFSYKANDGSADSNVVTVSIAVNAVNDAPVATADSASVNEGATLNGSSVLANDTDADNATLTAVLVSGPANAASFTLNANGTYTYVHNGSETTTDSFTYKANDGAADSNVVTVSIIINAVNDAPVANADAASVTEGGTLNGTSVLANDTDAENSSLTATLVSGPANASSFTLNADGTYTYVHNGGETTSDSFSYKANDGSADSNVVTVTITINAVNDAPVANADSYSTSEGGTLNGTSVLANDTDAENSTLTAVLVSGPANAASFTLNANGTFTYVHNGSETTSDSFTYKANDGSADSNVVTVSISVAAVNDTPVAAGDSYSTTEGGTLNVAAPGVLGNDTDGENSALAAVLVSGPANASSFALNADGSFNYVHNGGETTSDSFSYKANDGSADSNVVTVSISIAPVNDAPVAANDAYAATPNNPLNVAAPGVLANDTDADSASLTAVLVSGPSNASSFTLNANGSFSYTAASSGTDSFTYYATDGTSQSNIATVTITVQSLPPVANDDAYVAVGNTELRVGTGAAATPHLAVNGSVLANDTDADTPHGSLTVTWFAPTSANGGSVTMTPSGTFTYRPAAGSMSNDSFQYTVSDGSNSSTGTVRITFNGRVWYVRNNASAGDGRSHAPYSTLASAQAASAANDYIYVHSGNGTTTGHAAISLQNGQRLIGEGVALVVGSSTLAPAGSRPRLSGVTLGSGNTVSGLDVNSSAAGISGTGVNGGTISSVGISGGTTGLSLTNVAGSFALTNVSITPGSTGFSISGSANVNATNVTIKTTGATGIVGTGTGTLSFNGGSVATTNGTAVDLSNHDLAGSGLVSVSASNSTNGISLSNTTGVFTVAGSGAAGSGGTITGMSNRGVNAVNAGVSLASMVINSSALQGVLVQNALSAASTVSVRNTTFGNNFSTAVQTLNSGSGLMSVTIDGNSFNTNAASAAVQTTLGGVSAKITNNTSTFNSGSSAFSVTRNNAGTGAVDAVITGNSVGVATSANSGATCGGGCGAIALSSAGSNAFRALVDNNRIHQIDGVAIRAIANQGSSAMSVTITNNLIAQPVAGALFGVNVQSGSLSADTTAVCATIAGNNVSGGFTTDIAVRNTSAGSTFSLPGYAGVGTDTTAVANFIKANNTVATVTATRKTTAPANQFSGGGACATPAP